MNDMVVIVAPPDDTHAKVVSARLDDLNCRNLIWNATMLPWKDRMWWTPDDQASCRGEHNFDWADVRRVWWRRYRGATINPILTDQHVKDFCAKESRDMVRGLLAATGVPVTNEIDAERRANSKMLQLQVARRLGIAIPKTLVSNDQEALLAFLDCVPQAIIKPLQANYPRLVDTRICDTSYFSDEENTALSPAIVQELVVCVADIRVTIVDDRAFAAELKRDNPNEEVDWRLAPVDWRPHELPQSIGDSLIQFMKAMNLDTGSFDLRLTPKGEYVFLEVNPTGQFLFLEVDAGLPISQAFAEFLAR